MAGLTVKDSELLVWDASKTSMQVKLGEFVQYFQVGIANSDGTPRAYIDPTQIMPYLLQADSPDDLSDETIELAKVTIDFEDGIPTIEGIPFWERLEGEPVPYYKMFKEYRELKYLTEPNKGGSFTRSIAKLAESSGMSGKQLNALSKVYHWQLRVKAYDKFKEVERQLTRQRDIEQLETKHAKVSNQLLDQAVDYLLKHPEQLSPKVAIDLADLAMKAGRLSLGLNPDKPGASGGNGGGTHVSIVNQQSTVGDNSTMNQLNAFDGLSAVEKKTKENAQDVSHLQSILHVLNQSGAFAQAKGDEKKETDGVIDADYEVGEE